MKLKHRKLVLIISMSAMGIGLITFSIAGNKNKNTDEVSNISEEAVMTEGLSEASIDDVTNIPTPTEEITGTPTPTEEVTEAPTEAPTSTPTPTEAPFQLTESEDSEIVQLIKDYLQAKIDGKVKKLKNLVTDGSTIDIESIQKKTEFIESYDNIKVYTIPGYGDIDFIAYVYMEVKIASIDTKAPGLDEYCVKQVDGEYKIVRGEVSDETGAYIEEARQSEEVQALLGKVDKKLNKAMKKDEALADFCNQLGVTKAPEEE